MASQKQKPTTKKAQTNNSSRLLHTSPLDSSLLLVHFLLSVPVAMDGTQGSGGACMSGRAGSHGTSCIPG